MSAWSEKVTSSSMHQNLPNCSNCIMSIVKIVQIYPILHMKTSCMHSLVLTASSLQVSIKCVMFVISYSMLLLYSGVSFEVIAFVLFCFFVFHHMSDIFTSPLFCEWIPNSTGHILCWSLPVLLSRWQWAVKFHREATVLLFKHEPEAQLNWTTAGATTLNSLSPLTVCFSLMNGKQRGHDPVM